ncbi:MAG: protein translocase subunit SecD, partial [Candidatus Hydrothermarchaeales archaeon]
IIAAVGTGVDDQIVITDEVFMEREKSIRHRMKSAFFIIMAAWMTTVAAMLPLFSIGLQILRGFALTTIIGVTIGVAVTRPAYASLISNIIGGE